MTIQDSYDDEWATNYQRRADAAIPGREGLYRLCCAVFRPMPSNARVLVVGCGTGEDLIPLAKAFPLASFMGIDPSTAMLEVCAKRVAEERFDDRVRLEAIRLDALRIDEEFDAATAILVSQHIESDARAQEFFSTLAALIKPDGRLYSADMHIGVGQDRDAMLALWREQALMSGMEGPVVDGMLARFRDAVRPRDETTLVHFLQQAGFCDILKPFSSLIYGAWSARKRAPRR